MNKAIWTRKVMAAAGLLAAIWGPAGLAAQPVIVDGSTLRLNPAENDSMAVTAVGGLVKVNGADPPGGPLMASSIDRIVGRCTTGNETIDLSGVSTSTGFPDGGDTDLEGFEGNDTLIGAGVGWRDFIYGGEGDDVVLLGKGDDDVFRRLLQEGSDIVSGEDNYRVQLWNNLIDGPANFDVEDCADQVCIEESVGFVTQIVSIAGPAAFDMRGTRDGDTITFGPAMNVTRPLTLNPADGDDTVDFTGSTDNLIVSVSIQGSSGDDVVTSLPSIPVFVDFSFGGGSDPNVATVSRSGDDLIVEQTASDVRSLRANGVQTVSLSGGAGPNEISFGDVGDAGIGAINYIGGVDDDLITWTMQQTPGDLDAFIEVTADTLRIDVQGQPFMQEIIGNGGTISGQGFGDLQYGRFENLEFLNLPKSDLWLAKE